MSVLVFAEHQSGTFKKSAFEAVSYGRKTADQLGVECIALVGGSQIDNAGQLGTWGASRVVHIADGTLDSFDSQSWSAAIAEAATQLGATVIILNHSANGKTLLGRLAVRLNAGSVSAASALPQTEGSFVVRKNVFSGKAFADYELSSDIKVLSIINNAIPPQELGQPVSPETLSVAIPGPKVTIREVNRIEGTTPLPEAELVVSAGRGMKGPEHWGIIEELADALGATTACSRPVSDTGWRPHHEHVGQTGIAIRPNLYIAIGISGAIQHLAGVNRSKTIVVINKDPEAPFFKAADYGIVADLFDVVPKLTEAVRTFKAAQ
jgi:electron transfer flavoprotein alpha subunit